MVLPIYETKNNADEEQNLQLGSHGGKRHEKTWGDLSSCSTWRRFSSCDRNQRWHHGAPHVCRKTFFPEVSRPFYVCESFIITFYPRGNLWYKLSTLFTSKFLAANRGNHKVPIYSKWQMTAVVVLWNAAHYSSFYLQKSLLFILRASSVCTLGAGFGVRIGLRCAVGRLNDRESTENTYLH